MPRTAREVMTPDPVTVDAGATAEEAARMMRDSDVGGLIVLTDGQVSGFVTDRDITVRAVAEGRAPSEVHLRDICSTGLTSVTPDTPIDEIRTVMEREAIRRIPVVEGNEAVGIVALGDLAVVDDETETGEALAEISAAPANN
jgi:CBS domain-containing protein